jgi:hypothetical protein
VGAGAGMWLYKIAATENGVWGTIVSYGAHTIVDTMAPKGWHTIVAPLVEFARIVLPPYFLLDVEQNYQLLVPLLLAGLGRCLRGYGIDKVIITIIRALRPRASRL